MRRCDCFQPSAFLTDMNRRSVAGQVQTKEKDFTPSTLQFLTFNSLRSAASDEEVAIENESQSQHQAAPLCLPPKSAFDLETALFCSGLAFDSYIEPPANSSRWERGVSNDYFLDLKFCDFLFVLARSAIFLTDDLFAALICLL